MVRYLVVVCMTGCGLFPDVDELNSKDAGQNADVTVNDAPQETSIDASKDVASGSDASDASDGASCSCTNLVSAYRFAAANDLGQDFFNHNDMPSVHGTPTQSSVVPPNMKGHSIQLDGSSSVCIDTGFTFDSTSDHTLCWWSQPTALSDSTNQFAQTCGYDTWTTNNGTDYLWRINNCNNGTPANFVVPNVFTANTWVQICQTYAASAMKRTIVINGQTSSKASQVDSVPIVEPSTESWCIGSYNAGGFWTGRIYLPMWFDRVLSDAEIQNVYATACCLP